MTALAIHKEAIPAWHALNGRLTDLADNGAQLPCWTRGDLFVSEEPTERREAAEWCETCPALVACSAFADANRETFGTWGGRDRTPRPKRPSRARQQPREETAA